MDLSHVNRDRFHIYFFLSFTIFLGSKPYVVDSVLCALRSKVTLFSYVYFKTGIVPMIFPLKQGSF